MPELSEIISSSWAEKVLNYLYAMAVLLILHIINHACISRKPIKAKYNFMVDSMYIRRYWLIHSHLCYGTAHLQVHTHARVVITHLYKSLCFRFMTCRVLVICFSRFEMRAT